MNSHRIAREGQNVLVLGATSAIARAIANQLARDGCRVILAGRDIDEIERLGTDLRIRHAASIDVKLFDAVDFDSHTPLFESCAARFAGGLDGVILCYGTMPDQKLAERNLDLAMRSIQTNLASPVSILNIAANYFESRGHGFICALSSVAGDRGRQSNYLYGSGKAGLSAYLQGLRNRLTRSGISVTTVKPGFVDTAMTWGILRPGSPIVATPEKVASDICRAIRRGKAEIYTPWFWRYIMMIIKSIPEFIFRRMKL